MYKEMYEVYKRNPSVFPLAAAYLADKGFSLVKSLTDDDVASLKGNGMMTQEFIQDMVQTARDIVVASGNNAVEIIQFCAAEEIFDTRYYKGDFNDDEDDEDDEDW